MTIAAVIPAAGTGTRFSPGQQGVPKQYRPLAGQPIYMWSLAALCANARVTSVILVVSLDMFETAQKAIAETTLLGSSKVSVITGGASRQESVKKGLEYLSSQSVPPEHVLIHDAARPFLTQRMIEDTIKCVTAGDGCTLAIPLTDTVKRAENGVIKETLDRSKLWLIQTPQAGSFAEMLAAHRLAEKNGFATTDDAAVLEYAGHEVKIVEGTRYNLKITSHEDLTIGQALVPLVLEDQGRAD